MVRRSPLEYCWKACKPVQRSATIRINPYPTKSTEAVEVQERATSTVAKLKQHNTILPSEKGRNPSRRANATSPITTWIYREREKLLGTN